VKNKIATRFEKIFALSCGAVHDCPIGFSETDTEHNSTANGPSTTVKGGLNQCKCNFEVFTADGRHPKG